MARIPHSMGDYAGREPEGAFESVAPLDVEALQSLVVDANRQRRPIRIRGNGHSMNGLAVPRQGELVITMEHFCRFRSADRRTVTVGAGAAVWDLHRALHAYDLGLLVYNDGNAAAPSVGGFMAAGGFGAASHRHGGFWNTVLEVTLITGAGEIRVLRPDDPEFPWLFGSMGQLGIAVDLKLKVEPLRRGGSAPHHPQGSPSPQLHDERVHRSHPVWPPVVWFTVLVPLERGKEARDRLTRIGVRHRHAWCGLWPYSYLLRFCGFNPPLVHHHQGPLCAVGIWGHAGRRGFDWPAVDAIDAAVGELVASEPEYRRYVQAERTSSDFDYANCFGESVFQRFRHLKQQLDPLGLLVPGVFR